MTCLPSIGERCGDCYRCRPAPSAERDEIQHAAALSGEAWLHYMARYAEPAMCPNSWATAIAESRRIVAQMGGAA